MASNAQAAAAASAKRRKAGRKVPVTILTGFLGAGKTTLLNHILKSTEHKMKFAIIENEFGEVGIDEQIVIGEQERVEEEVIEVMNGCICCTVRGDLVESLKRLYKKVEKFDAVLIETTGLADPAPVAQTFFVDDAIQKLYTLDGIVTVVDAKHIEQHLDDKKAEGVENEAVEQLAFADRVILNKTDLVDEAKLKVVESRIKAINSTAGIIKSVQSQVDPKLLLGLQAFDINRILEKEPDFLDDPDAEHQHDDTVSSCAAHFEGELNVNKLQRWIQSLIGSPDVANNLFRYKGVLAVKGMRAKFVFQGVHMLFAGGFSDVHFWSEGEKRECRFVFIGRDLDKEDLLAGVNACMAKKELRFKVGDLVQANVGKWTNGKIIKLWNEGNPYRIELDDGKGTNVWGPIDADTFVRARP